LTLDAGILRTLMCCYLCVVTDPVDLTSLEQHLPASCQVVP